MKDFRSLLDRKPRNEQSRQKLATGRICLHVVLPRHSLLTRFLGQLEFLEIYSINLQFQQATLQVADTLDLDELDAARICLEAQIDSKTSGRSLTICSILRFHQRRKYLLDCMRLILQLADDIEGSQEGVVEWFRGVVAEVVQAQDPSDDSTKYVARCLTSMLDIKTWLQSLMDKLSGASVIGKERQSELEEVIEYQRISLVAQHETLSIIVVHLTKMDYSSVSNFELVLERLRTTDRYDHFLSKDFSFVPRMLQRFWPLLGGTVG